MKMMKIAKMRGRKNNKKKKWSGILSGFEGILEVEFIGILKGILGRQFLVVLCLRFCVCIFLCFHIKIYENNLSLMWSFLWFYYCLCV